MERMPGHPAQKESRQPGGGGKGNKHMLHVDESLFESKQRQATDPNARRILQQKIARSQTQLQPFAEVMVIDPAMASAMLDHNPPDENRKLSQSRVALYAADMEAGRWQGLNGQTIVISRDGYLNDGQHRLNAVIATGGSIPFTVVFGAERQSRLTLDQNKARTPGDYLGMSGVTNANKVAAVANSAGFSSPIPRLRQLAVRSVAPASSFPSLRDSSPRMDEAGTADHAFSSLDGACPGLTSIVIRGGGSFEVSSVRCERATGERDVRGGSRRSLPPVKFSPRCNAGFQTRHHTRRHCIKSFPSHGARTSFAATEDGSEGDAWRTRILGNRSR